MLLLLSVLISSCFASFGSPLHMVPEQFRNGQPSFNNYGRRLPPVLRRENQSLRLRPYNGNRGGNAPLGVYPMSPFSRYLSPLEQESLHELIIEARRMGANEPEIKEYINRYLKVILPEDKFEQLKRANSAFEHQLQYRGRGKREITTEKALPVRLFNLFDVYSDAPKERAILHSAKLFDDVTAKKLQTLD